ncbi:methyltransferase domain-containing protein [Mucilaginibacter terrigena]|uniref:Methyltransferase domain-containing protein n=1 Tax=Mucilaginibacter terrigena TaxID=2492395 RepID=A0A4Q5LQ89_9SPHI|nr:methyltransferase domain-containing protein [Mucilaginibacter terrigena]RYU91611.1 methyltransferase domain-containing protein [Mucilaginibacter terrigena]
MTFKQKIGALIIKSAPVSPEIISILRGELRAFRNRLNYRLNPFKKAAVKKITNAANISLNVGCGPFGHDGWVNVDLMALKNVSFTYDTRKHLPFKDNTVERIRVEHFFEHIDKSFEAPFFLEECKRVMKPGAVLRIAVPDVEKFINAYYLNDEVSWKALGYDINNLPNGFDTKIAILNHIFRQDGEHKYAYDWEAMHFLLTKHGFKNITRQQYRQSLDEQLIEDQFNHSNHSLYVDCVK